MATPIHQQGLGPGASAAQQAGTQARTAANLLDLVRSKGGAVLKILNEFAGPLALASGAALTFVMGIAKGVRQTEMLQRGLERIRKIQLYSPEFAKLLGGLAQAQRRLTEVWRLTAKSPFNFDDAAAGNKVLQVLTGGLLASRQGMKLMFDLAAAGGTSIKEISSLVGVLYDNLRNGRPIADEVEQLRMLGLISTDTANRLTVMSNSGAGFEEMWAAVRAELQKSEGSMKRLQGTLAGLQSRLSNAQDDQAKTIGEQFQEGEKAGLEAQIRATEAMTPVLKNVAVIVGSVWTAFQKMKAAVVEFATSLPGVKGGLVGVISGFAALVVLLAAFSVATTVQGILALTMALYGWATAAAAATGATGVLARAIVALGSAARFALGPWGALIAALSIAVGILADAAIEAHTFGKAQEDLRNSINETNQALQTQIQGIKTQGDKSSAMAAANQAVIDAQDRLTEAEKEQRKKSQDLNPLNDTSARQAVEDRKKDLEEAERTYRLAQNAPTDAGAESLLGEDYAAAKRDSEQRQQDLDKERRKLDEQRAAVEAFNKVKSRQQGFVIKDQAYDAAQARVAATGAGNKSVAQIAEEQRALAQKQANEADAFSQDNLDRRFAARQAMQQSRVDAMNELYKSTGDKSLRDQADKESDQIFHERRQRELERNGFTRDQATKQADTETLLQAATRERERVGRPHVSSTGAVGGSAGFAGLVNDVPRQTLEAVRRIYQESRDINQNIKKATAETGDEDKWRQ